MRCVRKDSLVKRVAVVMNEDLLKGRWVGYLPGLRDLARVYGVSVPTVRMAVGILDGEGVVALGGEKRRTRITMCECEEAGVRVDGGVRKRVVLVVAPKELHLVESTARTVVHGFERLMVKLGWVVEFRVIDYTKAKRPRKSWDVIMTDCDPYCVVALAGRDVLVEWAAKHGKRMAFCGGTRRDMGVPMISVSTEEMLARSLSELSERGVKHIVFPMVLHSEYRKERSEFVVSKFLAEAGLAYSRHVHTPVLDIWDLGAFERLVCEILDASMPDVLICSTEEEVVAVIGVLMRRKLQVGVDLGVVLLAQVESLKWFRPRLASFQFPLNGLTKGLVRICEKWVEGELVSSRMLKPKFDAGESLGGVGDSSGS